MNKPTPLDLYNQMTSGFVEPVDYLEKLLISERIAGMEEAADIATNWNQPGIAKACCSLRIAERIRFVIAELRKGLK